MKIKLILAVFISTAFTARAQTNAPIEFDQLLSCSNTVLMTNAEFRCVGSGERVFFLSGETYRFFPVSELNSNALTRIGLTPAKLKATAEADVKQKAAFAAEQVALAEYRYHLSTNVQIIQVFSTDGLNCDTSRGNITLKNLPASVSAFLSQKEQLQTEIQDLENYHPIVRTTVYDPNDPDPAGTAEFLNQQQINRSAAEKREKLDDLRSQLNTLEFDDAQRTTVQAYFTGGRYAGMEVWQCVGMGIP